MLLLHEMYENIALHRVFFTTYVTKSPFAKNDNVQFAPWTVQTALLQKNGKCKVHRGRCKRHFCKKHEKCKVHRGRCTLHFCPGSKWSFTPPQGGVNGGSKWSFTRAEGSKLLPGVNLDGFDPLWLHVTCCSKCICTRCWMFWRKPIESFCFIQTEHTLKNAMVGVPWCSSHDTVPHSSQATIWRRETTLRVTQVLECTF